MDEQFVDLTHEWTPNRPQHEHLRVTTRIQRKVLDTSV